MLLFNKSSRISSKTILLLFIFAHLAIAATPQAVITVDEPAYYATSDYFTIIDNLELSLIRGYAPFPVFFQGWESSPREELIRYEWDFGPGTEVDELGRTFNGFNAAHVFETPGTYNVTLRVLNEFGEWSTSAGITIEVLSRDSANTYYVDSDIGNDSYDGLNQTVDGGGHGPWQTANKAFEMIQKPGNSTPLEDWPLKPGDRVLFKRGQAFSLYADLGTETALINTGNGGICQGVQYGAYGNPGDSKPQIRWEGVSGESIFKSYNGTAYLVFSDLDINFYNSSNDSQLRGLIRVYDHCRNLLMLRCDFHNPHNCVWTSQGDLSPAGFFVVSCSVDNHETALWSVNQMGYGKAYGMALLNNRCDESAQHMHYLTNIDKGIIARNILTRPAWGRTALRITGGPSCGNIHIKDNVFYGWIDPLEGGGIQGGSAHGGNEVRYNYQLITLPPGRNHGENLAMDHVIFEQNVIANFEIGMLFANTTDMIIRNNLFVTPIHGLALMVGEDEEGWWMPLENIFIYGNTFIVGPEDAHNPDFPIIRVFPYPGEPSTYGTEDKNIRIFNNLFAGYPGAEPGGIIELVSPTEAIVSDHNLFHFPDMLPSLYFRRSGTYESLDSWRAATENDINSFSGEAGFAGPFTPFGHGMGEPSNQTACESEKAQLLMAFHLTEESQAVDAGTELGADLFYDFDGYVRPADGDGSGTRETDIGAFEYEADSTLRYIKFILYPNYPNPFNTHTTIEFYSPNRSHVKLIIYDLLGRQVRILFDDIVEEGIQTVQWDGTGYEGKKVSGGIYFCQLIGPDGFASSKKMIFLK
jgi:PKD repeat protein